MIGSADIEGSKATSREQSDTLGLLQLSDRKSVAKDNAKRIIRYRPDNPKQNQNNKSKIKMLYMYFYY
jgi:hypothetical protein